MKVAIEKTISQIVASSYFSDYRATNLLDRHPKRLWMADSSSATLTIEVPANTSALAIFNTNADSLSFAVADPDSVDWETGVVWENGVGWEGVAAGATAITSLNGVDGSAIVQWTPVSSPVTVIVTMSNSADEKVYAGIAQASAMLTYAGPRYGWEVSGIDRSIVSELSNGADYIKDRDVIRAFTLSAIEGNTDFASFMDSVFKVVKSKPTAWLLSTSPVVLIYARFNRRPPSGRYSNLDIVEINFDLVEVL